MVTLRFLVPSFKVRVLVSQQNIIEQLFFDLLELIYDNDDAAVVELVDTLDLKSNGQECPCRFDSGQQYKYYIKEKKHSLL